MLLHHVEGSSWVPCGIDPGKLKQGSENCTWAIEQGGEGELCRARLLFAVPLFHREAEGLRRAIPAGVKTAA